MTFHHMAVLKHMTHNVLCLHGPVHLTDGAAMNTVLQLLHMMKYVFTEITFPHICIFYNL
jgi:hypothetical protein